MSKAARGRQEGKKPGPTPKTAEEWRAHNRQKNLEHDLAVADLTDKVARLFPEHWPDRQRYPSAEACYSIATSLRTIQIRRKKPPDHELGTAAKYATVFLAHAAKAKQRVAGKLSDYDGIPDDRLSPPNRAERDRLADLLAALDHAEATVKPLQAERKHETHFPDMPPAVFVAKGIVRAWLETGEDVSLARTWGEAPLCRFLADALMLINVKRSSETVRADLRPYDFGD